MKKLCILLFIVMFVFVLRVDAQFDPAIAEFEFQVPVGYNPVTQVDASAKKAKLEKSTYNYNVNLTSSNYSKTSGSLVAGDIYIVKIFPVTESVTSQQCLTFLKKQEAILAGAQGLTLVYDLAKSKLPKDKKIISFSPKEELWTDPAGNHGVPFIHVYAEGDYSFDINYFEYDWIGDGRTILCIIKKG